MNVEKTIGFILRQQAKTEAWQAKTEGQMAAIRKLIQAGMRMLVKQGERISELAAAQKETATELRSLAAAQKETNAELQRLAAAQRVTESKLQGLIDAVRRGGNGSRPKK